uniref:Exonuclease 3'-5' domain-containing protein 2 n=1 Tax=Timema genevievae TaxID=629358 RepID=A0A7R9K2N4_TIMGE|nr:unnamed protein product [Timema genevievae]
MSSKNKDLSKGVIFATVGLGLAYLLAKYRTSVLNFLNNNIGICIGLRKDPLRCQRVLVVTDQQENEEVTNMLRKSCTKLSALGFDCEWVTERGSRRPVALLQLASVDGLCALYRLCKVHYIPTQLKELLEDPSILKVGVAPSDDAKYLLADYGVKVRGCLDLRHLAKLHGNSTGGLGSLAQTTLGVKLDKNWRVRCSDWEAQQLDAQQLDYAAKDALVGIVIFAWLTGLTKHWPWSRVSTWDKVYAQCNNLVDVRFKQKGTGGGDIKTKNGIQRLSIRKQSSRSYATRKKPLYHNCFMEAPDGDLLCSSDLKKAEWYISKGLAEKVSDDPFTIRLNFEPSGRAVGDVGKYYKQVKNNCCVVCGSEHSFHRKFVIPSEYRKLFPSAVMKDHQSHDVLLMCTACHVRSNMEDMALREELARKCNAPIQEKKLSDPDLRSVQSAANALVNRSANKIPEQRREELTKIVQRFYGTKGPLTKEQLQEVSSMESRVPNKDYEPHGHKVVQFFSEQGTGGLVTLERMWREHFLTTMRPRFLPELWSVSHNQQRLTIRKQENRIRQQELEMAGLA